MKYIFNYLFIYFLFSAVAYSQPDTDEDNIPLNPTEIRSLTASATATVLTGVTISKVGTNTLNYGDIFTTGSVQTRTITNANGQKFLATGSPGYNVLINYSASVTLSNALWVAQYGGTTSTILFNANPVPSGTLANSNYVSPYPITNGGSYVLTNSGGIGKLYIWVGGKITIAASQPIGDYKGTFTISLSY